MSGCLGLCRFSGYGVVGLVGFSIIESGLSEDVATGYSDLGSGDLRLDFESSGMRGSVFVV